MTKPPTDPRYPAHGVTVKTRPYIVSDYVPDDVWNECVQLANDHGYDLFKIADDEGEIIVMKQRLNPVSDSTLSKTNDYERVKHSFFADLNGDNIGTDVCPQCNARVPYRHIHQCSDDVWKIIVNGVLMADSEYQSAFGPEEGDRIAIQNGVGVLKTYARCNCGDVMLESECIGMSDGNSTHHQRGTPCMRAPSYSYPEPKLPKRRSFFALKPGEKGKSGVVAE
jgi:hypothetical protein